MESWDQVLDRAAQQVADGPVSAALGKRAAAIFQVLLSSAIPNSIAFSLWLGLGLFSSTSPEEFGLGSVGFELTVACLVALGVAGLAMNVKALAMRATGSYGLVQR